MEVDPAAAHSNLPHPNPPHPLALSLLFLNAVCSAAMKGKKWTALSFFFFFHLFVEIVIWLKKVK